MTMKQKELYNVIESLPEELSNKVVDYIEYLKFSYITNNAPDDLVIKDDKDLLNNNYLIRQKMIIKALLDI